MMYDKNEKSMKYKNYNMEPNKSYGLEIEY